MSKKESSLEIAKKLANMKEADREKAIEAITENKEAVLDVLADVLSGETAAVEAMDEELYELMRKGFTVPQLKEIAWGIEGADKAAIKKMKEGQLIHLISNNKSPEEIQSLLDGLEPVEMSDEEKAGQKQAKKEAEEKAKESAAAEKLGDEQQKAYDDCTKECHKLEEKGDLKGAVKAWNKFAESAPDTAWAEKANARAGVIEGVIDATTEKKTAGRKPDPIDKEELKEDMQNLILKLNQYTLQLRDEQKSGIATFNRAKRDLIKIVRITFR